MRILVQRVTSASVKVDGVTAGAIEPDGQGLLALVGVTHDDDLNKAQRLAEKLWQLRILDGERSAADVAAPILVISQFTLYANTTKGRRPTWNAAAPGAVAEPLVGSFADALRTWEHTSKPACSARTCRSHSSTTDPSPLRWSCDLCGRGDRDAL